MQRKLTALYTVSVMPALLQDGQAELIS